MFAAIHDPARSVSTPCTNGHRNGSLSGSTDSDDLRPVDRGDLHDVAGARCMDHRATTDVDGDVTDRRLVEDQVARLDLALRDVRDRPVLCARLVREVHACLTPRVLRETGAVE